MHIYNSMNIAYTAVSAFLGSRLRSKPKWRFRISSNDWKEFSLLLLILDVSSDGQETEAFMTGRSLLKLFRVDNFLGNRPKTRDDAIASP